MLLVSAGFFLLATFGSVLPAVREVKAETPLQIFSKVIGFIVCEALIVVFFVAMMAIVTLLSLISRRNKPLYCEKTITLGETHYIGESEYGMSEVRWAMVQKLARTRNHIFIYLSADNAVVIPRRAFESSTQWDEFYNVCRQRINCAG
jgi:hypothetical protein